MSGEHDKLIEAARHNAESHESIAAMLDHDATLTQQGYRAVRDQCIKYAAEARAALSAIPPPFPADGAEFIDSQSGDAYRISGGEHWLVRIDDTLTKSVYYPTRASFLAAIASGELRAVEKASPVRCWRAVGGWTDRDNDRIRWTGARMEWVRKDGTIEKSELSLNWAEQEVRDGRWLPCPDAPYSPPVATVVKESVTTAPVATPEMPPMGMCCAQRELEALRRLHIAACRWADKTSRKGPEYHKFRCALKECNAVLTGRNHGLHGVHGGGAKATAAVVPAPARESAEAAAANRCSWPDFKGVRPEAVAALITARDATWQTEVDALNRNAASAWEAATKERDAKDATIARLTEANAALDKIAARRNEKIENRDKLIVDLRARLAALESRPPAGDEAWLNKELEFAYDLANECDRHPTEFGKGRASGLRDCAGNIGSALAALAALRGEAPR